MTCIYACCVHCRCEGSGDAESGQGYARVLRRQKGIAMIVAVTLIIYQ